MFRAEFLKAVWNLGMVEAKDLARILSTSVDLVLFEAHHCAEQGWIRLLDTVIFATPNTNAELSQIA